MDRRNVSAAPPGLRERNKIDKLRRIIDAARELFIVKGFDDTTTREIALRAGVGLGTVFVYAANKRDLLFLTVNEELETITAGAEASINEKASLLENLIDISKRHYEFFGQQPALSRLVLREMVFYDSGTQAGRFQTTRERLIELIAKSVQFAIDQKEIFSNEKSQIVGWTIFCIFQVELRHWLSQDNPDLANGLNLLRRSLILLINGLKPTKSALTLPR